VPELFLPLRISNRISGKKSSQASTAKTVIEKIFILRTYRFLPRNRSDIN